MKILMIGWGLPPNSNGGLDTYCKNIVRELSENNEVYLTIPSFNMPKDPGNVGNTCIVPIEIGSPEEKTMIEKVIEYNNRLAESLSAERFDVVQANDWFSVLGAHKLREINKTPFIFAVHSTESMRQGKEERIKNDIDFIENLGMKEADLILTVSRMMKEKIIKDYRVDEKRIRVVHHGMELNSQKTKKKYSEKITKVLYVGRLTEQKGVEFLLLAARDALKKNNDLRFIIVGQGHMKKRLEKFTKILGIEKNVEFTGWIEEEELTRIYRNADIFVSPSVWEPFGLTVTEAISNHLPVIATERTGVTEEMKNGIHFAKVPVKNSSSIKNVILMLSRNKKDMKRLSDNAYEFCKNRYSWKESARKTAYVYSELK